MFLSSMFNLELLAKFGPNAWRVHNYQLEGELKQLQQTTSEYRDAVLRINRERKTDQVINKNNKDVSTTKFFG